jgi:hypothetical protein
MKTPLDFSASLQYVARLPITAGRLPDQLPDNDSICEKVIAKRYAFEYVISN